MLEILKDLTIFYLSTIVLIIVVKIFYIEYTSLFEMRNLGMKVTNFLLASIHSSDSVNGIAPRLQEGAVCMYHPCKFHPRARGDM
jgi:hypothetical protein